MTAARRRPPPDPDDALVPGDTIASGRGAGDTPLHRGWAPAGARHRWMEPFVLAVLATGHGHAHGYAITGELELMGITTGGIDIGQVYRTLRDLEAAGHVTSSWSSTAAGPQRREYRMTDAGYRALDEWAAVMKERVRLIGEFEGRYLDVVTERRG